MAKLIDVDVLMDDIRKHSESYFADDFAHIWVDKQPTVDAVPIEWINQRVKGLKIQLINADEDDVDLIWHLRDEIQTLTELIDYWKEEQEKQNGETD